MALFKKAEFALHCGISNAHVTMGIKRGKLIQTDDGMIDSEHIINLAFIAHRKEVEAKRAISPEKPEVAPEPGKPPKKQKKQAASRPKVDPTQQARLDGKFQVEIDEKKARTAKLDRELRLLEMKEMKLMGQVIPTDLVANTIRQLMQSVTVAFNDGADAFINDMAKSLKIDRTKMATIRKQMKEIVNASVNRAVDDAQKNIENIVQEHSQGKAA